MEGYEKTEILSLNKITDTNIVDIDAIQENFNEVEKNIGKISGIEIDGFNQDIELSSEKSVANFIKFIWKKLNSIELTDLKVKVTTDGNKTLDKVLKAIKNSIGTLTSLKTNEKNSTVGAINEVFDTTTNLKQADNLLNEQLNAINSKITTNNAEFDRLNRQFRQLNGGE
ncbi:hypothetical protein [Peptostreptococcus sp. D1]|uniref:hypothetical protein n=1 Tax=Peptostreptococcus sp. D1 TaxID=72304 RepID=UPI0008EA5275|nr:hypothetical protein [Peptostreptococcus sp. D1]SFE87579.1 hypothetical protein SAMN02910278_01932 [Peptostreptococcus sp. D1]